jgi:GntR family transcriptional regulator, transcriptional repressor for pyruvate dehydrogenase complex
MFAPVHTRRTFEEAVEQIADAIRRGTLGPGDRLPSERDLAEQMKISRPTLREATRVLAESGVIEVKPGAGGGMFVLSATVPVDLVETRATLRMSEVAAVLEARRLFEPRVAQLAALNASDDDFDFLADTIRLQRECDTSDRQRMNQLDIRFHNGIARATKNTVVEGLMVTLLRKLEIARDMTMREPRGAEIAIGLHEDTLDAIMSGDPGRVGEAMDRHLTYLEQIWEQETGRLRLRKVPEFLLGHSDRALAALTGAGQA